MEHHVLKFSLLILCRTTVGSLERDFAQQYDYSHVMTPVCKQSCIGSLVTSRVFSNHFSSTPLSVLLAGMYVIPFTCIRCLQFKELCNKM